MIDIQISIDSSQVRKKLQKIERALTDMTPIMKAIGRTLESSIEDNFETEGARLGTPWKRSRRAQKENGKTLQDTGRLAASIISQADRNSVVTGTNVEYGPIHQFGGTISQAAQSRLQSFRVDMKTGRSRFSSQKRANFEQWTSRGDYDIDMPARPFLGVNEQDEQAILRTIARAIERAMG